MKKVFTEIFAKFFEVFAGFFKVFEFFEFFEAFGLVLPHLDPCAPIGMHSDAFGSNWERLDVFEKF